MECLVFIDDDEDELEQVKALVAGAYEYVPIHWPREKPTEASLGAAPAIFVSDLYLPPADYGYEPLDYGQEVLEKEQAMAN